MIFYTHSYHRNKTGLKLIESGLVSNKVYVNKIHTIGKNVKLTLSKYKDSIIYDSPLYISNFVDNTNEFVKAEIEKRDLIDELTDGSKVFDYLNNTSLYFKDIKECWNNYLKKIPTENIEKVISLPAYNKNLEENWGDLVKIIPNENYKWASLAIGYDNINFLDINLLTKRVIDLKFKLNLDGIFFTILSNEQNIQYQEIDLIILNRFIKEVSKKTKLIIHHADTLAMQSTEVKNLSFGLYNQTKSMSVNQQPFIEINGFIRGKSDSFISSNFMSDIHLKRFRSNVTRLKDLGFEKYKEYKELEVVKKQVDAIFSNHKSQEGSIFIDAIEFNKILNMSKDERIEATNKFNDIFNKLPLNKKEIVYKIDGSKLKIL